MVVMLLRNLSRIHIVVEHIGVGTRVEKLLNNSHVALLCSEHERGESSQSAFNTGVRETGIVVKKKRDDSLMPPITGDEKRGRTFRGFDIDIGPTRQKKKRDIGMAVVTRQ